MQTIRPIEPNPLRRGHFRRRAAHWVLIAGLSGVIAGCSSVSGALSHFGKATDSVPDNAVTVAALLKDGDAARDKGDLDTAATDYAKAALTNPTSFDALSRLGAISLARKDNDGAYTAFKAAQALAPNDPEAAFRLGELDLTRGNAKDASSEFAIAFASRDDDPKLYNAMGVSLNMQGKFDQAKESYDKGLTLEPNYPALRNNYGLLQLETGDLPGALDTFTALVASPQASDRYRLNRALVELAMGQPAKALADAPGMDEPALRQSLATYIAPPGDGLGPTAERVSGKLLWTAPRTSTLSPRCISRWIIHPLL